jgi:hypothetical protein
VKRTSILGLLLAAVALLSTSCGTSDYIKSVTLSSVGQSGGFNNMSGVDGTVQLVVTANYNSGKQIDVTNAASYQVTAIGTVYSSDDPSYPQGGVLPPFGPGNVTIDGTGLMTAIAAVCSWQDLVGSSGPDNPAVWAYTGYYQVIATYRNFTTQPIGIGIGVTESNAPTGGCGPS